MMSRATLAIVTAAISVVATSALWIGGIAVAYRVFVGNPPPFVISIEAPGETTLGEIVTLSARVSNPTEESLQLGSIDVYDSLLDGFAVVQIEPAPDESTHTLDFSTFYYSKTLAPGETFGFSLVLKAVQPGVWTGDVDFCTPSEKFVASSVTIRVRAEPEGPSNGSPPVRPGTNQASPADGPRR